MTGCATRRVPGFQEERQASADAALLDSICYFQYPSIVQRRRSEAYERRIVQ